MKLRNILAAACAIAIIAAAPAFAAKTLLKDNALASYYGAQYHGRPTSSGEIFDMYGMTAAHRTLPFGTMLEITNLENGSSVVVRVNDRGPFVEGREIDVSLGAAEKLGMIASGVARVSISILDDVEVNTRTVPQTNGATVVPVQRQPAPAPVPPAAQVQPLPAPLAENASPAPVAPAQPAVAPTAESTSPVAPIQPAAQVQPVPAPLAENVSPAQPALPLLPASAESSVALVANSPASPPAVVAPQPAEDSYAPASNSGDSPVWRIQLGSFLREENAIRLVRQIRAAGIEPAYERNGDTVRVVIAGISDSNLEGVKSALDKAGLYDYVIRKER